jgi:hypothetical protein
MTTYNTMNPVPSADARDRYDNSQVFDELMNGAAPSTPDRLGVLRQSWSGMEQAFNQFLINSGFEPNHLTYVDGSPLQVDRPTQLIDRAGSVYRVKMPASFPVMLTGTWATDEALLVDVGDESLRQALSDENLTDSGAALVGRVPLVINSLADFQAVPAQTNRHYLSGAYYANGTGAGGAFVWSPATAKSTHDGGKVISPTVPWDGTLATHSAFLAGTGETDPSGNGAFVRIEDGTGFKMSQFGALESSDHTVIFNHVLPIANGSRLTADVTGGIISGQITCPNIITIDFTGAPYTLVGDEDFYLYANATDQLHLIRPYFIDTTEFAGRTKYHRAIRAEYVRLVTLVRPVIDGASTGIHTLFCGTVIADHVELLNIKGTLAQYGYGFNTSADATFIGSINFDNNASTGHGRHALYINGSAKRTYLGSMRVSGCVYNPVNTAIDDNITGTIQIGYLDFVNCNTSPLSNRVGCVHLTGQGAGTVGPANVVCRIEEIKSVGSAGGLFTIGQDGYYGSRVGRLISRSPISSATNGMAMFHTRFASNVTIDEIDVDALPDAGGISYVAEIRDSSKVTIKKIRVGGAVGTAAVNIFNSTEALIGDIYSGTIPATVENGTNTWSRICTDNAFYLIGGGTPATGGKRNLYTTATGLSITFLTGAADGDIVNIVSMGGSTTIVKNDALIITKSGASVVLGVKGSIQLLKRGSVWIEI